LTVAHAVEDGKKKAPEVLGSMHMLYRGGFRYANPYLPSISHPSESENKEVILSNSLLISVQLSSEFYVNFPKKKAFTIPFKAALKVYILLRLPLSHILLSHFLLDD
tara:strand:+ start:621 stop:941 length:321 start_codon:yes stop_codon:yes gene_type:complete